MTLPVLWLSKSATAPRMSSGRRSGEVASRSTRMSKRVPSCASACSRQCRMAGSFAAVSVAIASGRLTTHVAPWRRAMARMSSESLLTAIASNSPLARAWPSECAISGRPARSRVFFERTPLEPARAQMVQRRVTARSIVRWRRPSRWRRRDRAPPRLPPPCTAHRGCCRARRGAAPDRSRRARSESAAPARR